MFSGTSTGPENQAEYTDSLKERQKIQYVQYVPNDID